jgi:hypothetical protein
VADQTLDAHEEWRPSPSPSYDVSSLGRVRRSRGGPGTKVGRVMKPVIGVGGYFHVTLSEGGKIKCWSLQRLVCWTFHGAPPTPEHEAAHNNGKCLDCRASNLRWATRLENRMDSIRQGTLPHKLSDDDVRAIRAISGQTAKQIAQQYGVSFRTIQAIRRGEKRRYV